MLAAENSGYLRSETAEHHALRIYEIPLAFHGLCLCHIALHAMTSN
jgi:hypothetical protein